MSTDFKWAKESIPFSYPFFTLEGLKEFRANRESLQNNCKQLCAHKTRKFLVKNRKKKHQLINRISFIFNLSWQRTHVKHSMSSYTVELLQTSEA